jgi:hypothetical protein
LTVVASNYARQANDLYQTEPWATRALLRNLPLSKRTVVWEPFAGNHMMADVIRDAGYPVITSDFRNYNRAHTFIANFFQDHWVSRRLLAEGAIISNPPYGKGNRLAATSCRKALDLCDGIVAMLLTAKFDCGKSRNDLFVENTRFAMKIVLVDRIQWFPSDDGVGGTEDHAWYVWGPVNRVYSPPIIIWEARTYRSEWSVHPRIIKKAFSVRV